MEGVVMLCEGKLILVGSVAMYMMGFLSSQPYTHSTSSLSMNL